MVSRQVGGCGERQQEVDALSPSLAQLSPSPTPALPVSSQVRPFPGAPWGWGEPGTSVRLAEGPRPLNPTCHQELGGTAGVTLRHYSAHGAGTDSTTFQTDMLAASHVSSEPWCVLSW